MLEIKLNSPIPIYTQLIVGIKQMIIRKELEPGEALPSIRSLASTLEVAINTVARAYNELERLGYVKSYGMKGTFVCERIDEESKIIDDVKMLLSKLIQQGYTHAHIHRIIDSQLREIET